MHGGSARRGFPLWRALRPQHRQLSVSWECRRSLTAHAGLEVDHRTALQVVLPLASSVGFCLARVAGAQHIVDTASPLAISRALEVESIRAGRHRLASLMHAETRLFQEDLFFQARPFCSRNPRHTSHVHTVQYCIFPLNGRNSYLTVTAHLFLFRPLLVRHGVGGLGTKAPVRALRGCPSVPWTQDEG